MCLTSLIGTILIQEGGAEYSFEIFNKMQVFPKNGMFCLNMANTLPAGRGLQPPTNPPPPPKPPSFIPVNKK